MKANRLFAFIVLLIILVIIIVGYVDGWSLMTVFNLVTDVISIYIIILAIARLMRLDKLVKKYKQDNDRLEKLVDQRNDSLIRVNQELEDLKNDYGLLFEENNRLDKLRKKKSNAVNLGTLVVVKKGNQQGSVVAMKIAGGTVYIKIKEKGNWHDIKDVSKVK